MAQVLPQVGQNYLAGLTGGLQAGGAIQDMNRQNALSQLYKTQGADLAQGDPEALNALAALDPMRAYDMRRQNAADKRDEQRFGMETELNEANLANIRQTMKIRTAEEARKISAAEREENARQVAAALSGAAAAYEQGPEAIGTWVQQNADNLREAELDPAGINYETFPAIVAAMEGAQEGLADGVEMAGSFAPEEQDLGDRYKTVGGQLIDLQAEGGPAPVSGIDGRSAGLNITLADGTTISDGGIPGGQNPQTSATPRDPGKMSEELSKADVEYLDSERAKARTAESIMENAKQLELLAGDMGYTGPLGGLYGAVDDAVGGLPGNEGSRAQFERLAFETRAALMESLKGAISDTEQAMLARANPSLSRSKEGNIAMAQIMQRGAQRIQTRAKFMEAWANRRGGLQGAEAAWDQYIADNPMLVEGDSGLQVREEGDWSSYLDGTATVDLTPQSIANMGAADLRDLDITKMTSQQRTAYRARLEQLAGAN